MSRKCKDFGILQLSDEGRIRFLVEKDTISKLKIGRGFQAGYLTVKMNLCRSSVWSFIVRQERRPRLLGNMIMRIIFRI